MNPNYIQKAELDMIMLLAISVVMFFLTLSALSTIGFVPSYIDGVYPDGESITIDDSENEPTTLNSVALNSLPQLGSATGSLLPPPQGTATQVAGIEPERIVIHSIGVDLPVLNPEDTAVAALDEALLSGVVRYPLSGKLNEDGNMFIFGHSSSVAVVKNPMYKAFNRLGELRDGDTIKVVGDGMAHIYRVSEVRRADVSEELIDLSPTKFGRKLTLSTCDSFGGKSSRFVIEADFIGAYKNE